MVSAKDEVKKGLLGFTTTPQIVFSASFNSANTVEAPKSYGSDFISLTQE